ncbi:MAG: hypothetical protein QUS08_07675 [Methanothrix sp.]|nr:hypothetical protein [Methanothrix sp.]
MMGLPTVERRIRVGGAIEAGDRTIYPVFEVLLLGYDGAIGGWLRPLAFLVVEGDLRYALSSSGDGMDLEDILDLAPSLGEI